METFFKILIAPVIFVLSSAGYAVTPQSTFDTLSKEVSELTSTVELQKSQIEKTEQKFGAFTTTSAGTYRLSNSISSTATTINLSSFKEPISNIAYTMTQLGTTVVYGTLDPQNSTKSETISFTGITQNANGTAQLTGVTRGLSRSPGVSACTASTTLATSHSGQTVFILSNPSCFYSEFAVKRNDEVVTGSWTVPAPLSAGNPTTKTYVDSLVNGGAVSYDKIVVAGTAGETIDYAGQVLYLKQSDARWYKAATTIAEASTTIIGLAQGSGTTGVAINGGVLLSGLDSNQASLTEGVKYFMSSTAGATSTATSTRILGIARNATTLYFNTSSIIEGFKTTDNTIEGRNTFIGATTTFSNAATSSVVITATSSLKLGAFPAYNIGKNIKIITTTGTSTFTVPLGISKIFVQLVGGGGAGGGCVSGGAGLESSGGGGGGGGYSQENVDVTGTSSITVFVGIGGVGNSSSGTVGSWTTFGVNGFYLSATPGGNGDEAGGNGGGVGSGGDLNLPGAPGANGLADTDIGTSQYIAGGGGHSMFGFAPPSQPKLPSSGNGTSADVTNNGYGAGGMGAYCTASQTSNGGAGTQGLIVITW